MKNHIVSTENYVHHFKEIESFESFDQISEMGFDPSKRMEVWGPGKSVSEFVQKIHLESWWIPYGYCLRFVLTRPGSTAMTAFLFKNPKS